MKLVTKLKTTLKNLKLKATNLKQKCSAPFRPENLKNLKVVKWYRNSKAWSLHLDRRMDQYKPSTKSIDQAERDCINCGHHYSGRVCPQCGQVGTWTHYTWKQVILNFLDIWGMGNRPMFRTLGELFWRPGYMIRDYLNGHRQFYFPPFKLVAVIVVLLIFVGWLTGIHVFSPFGFYAEASGLNEANDWEGVKSFVESQLAHYSGNISEALLPFISAMAWFVLYISKNMLYEWLFIGAILVVCIWIAFKSVNKYNFVETYIFLTYVLAQILLCMIPGILLYWLNDSFRSLSPFFHSCSGFVLVLYIISVCILLILVFRQFFGLTWKSTISYLFLTLLVGIGLFFLIAVLIFCIATKDVDEILKLLVGFVQVILLVKGFSFAAKYYKTNEGQVPRSVIIASKVAMLSIFSIFKVSNSFDSFFQYILILLSVILLAIATVSLSLLPIVVYKKYHSTWLALLSILPVVILFFFI